MLNMLLITLFLMQYTVAQCNVHKRVIRTYYFCLQFVRVRSSADPAQIYELLTEQWGLAPPHLVVALVGGDELAQMKPWLRDTVRKGLVKAAQSTGMTHSQNFSFKLHCLLHCCIFAAQ